MYMTVQTFVSDSVFAGGPYDYFYVFLTAFLSYSRDSDYITTTSTKTVNVPSHS